MENLTEEEYEEILRKSTDLAKKINKTIEKESVDFATVLYTLIGMTILTCLYSDIKKRELLDALDEKFEEMKNRFEELKKS